MLTTRLQNEGNKEQGKYTMSVYIAFRSPLRATRIVEVQVFRLNNSLNERGEYIYIAFRSTRETRFRNWEIYLTFSYTRVTRFTTRSSVGQHAYRTKEIKSKGNIYLNRRYCRSRLKKRGIHAYVACLLWQYIYIDNFFRSKRVICTG